MTALLVLALCQDAGWEWRVYADAGVWGGDWAFEVETVAREGDIDGSFATFASAGIEVATGRGLELFVEYEQAFGEDLDFQTFIAGAGYGWTMKSNFPGSRLAQAWNVTVGLLTSRAEIDESDFPGDFDRGFGAQVMVKYRLLSGGAFGLHVRGGLRWARFDYDEPDIVVDSDDSLGGVAGLASVGVELRF